MEAQPHWIKETLVVLFVSGGFAVTLLGIALGWKDLQEAATNAVKRSQENQK